MNEAKRDAGKILLAHGGGGRLTRELVENLILPVFRNPILEKLEDSACLRDPRKRLAFTTDSYVVKPLFFPGGDIGRLAIAGTVNDLAMAGASPLYMAFSMIIEEGFSQDLLRRVISSAQETADSAGVEIVAGDTKVVEKGSADGLFLTVTGLGVIEEGIEISAAGAKPGDLIVVSGLMGEHGIAILTARKELGLGIEIKSDCAPLNRLVEKMLAATRNIHCLRDPTRGGLAATLCEIAGQSGVGMLIEEEKVPVSEEVRGACEMLGLDPLHLANEGKLVAVLPPEDTDKVLAAMREDPLGSNSVVIGEVKGEEKGRVLLRTLLGGLRLVEMGRGEELPRIC